MAIIRFYGSLRQFGAQHTLDVKDTAEAVRALVSQLPKLAEWLRKGALCVKVKSEHLDNRYLEQGLSRKLKQNDVVDFIPIPQGGKRAGVFQTIVGVALMVSAFWLGPMAFYAGLSMTLGGIAQMMTKTPKLGETNQTEKKQSTSFGNVQNLTAQGQAVPLAYGRIMAGSMIISQGVENFDDVV